MEEFLKFIDEIEIETKDLVWKIPKVPKKEGTVFSEPYIYLRPWSIPKSTGEFLHQLVLERKPTSILELGMSVAYSTLWLAHAAHTYGGEVFSIEKFAPKYEVAKKNIQRSELDNITTFCEEIQTITSSWFSPIDFLFMDADKQRYATYLDELEPHLTQDCLIVVDNAGNFRDRMKNFFEYLDAHKDIWQYEFKDLDNGLLLIRRKQAPL